MFWLQRSHFSVNELWEHVDFQVISAYDVVAAPGWRIDIDEQAWSELWLIREGRCEIVQDGRRAVANAGDAVLLQRDQSRSTVNLDDAPLSILGFSCMVQLAGGIDFLALLDLPLAVAVDVARFQSLLDAVVEESREHSFGYAFALHGWAHLALVEVLRAANEPDGDNLKLRASEKLRSKLSSEITRVLQYIETNFADEFDVSTLAHIAHLSPKHFSRRFRDAVGLSPMEYVRQYRLQQATQRLASHEESIAITSAKCGFVDAAHFSRAFKAHFKVTPLAYKQHFRAMKITP